MVDVDKLLSTSSLVSFFSLVSETFLIYFFISVRFPLVTIARRVRLIASLRCSLDLSLRNENGLLGGRIRDLAGASTV